MRLITENLFDKMSSYGTNGLDVDVLENVLIPKHICDKVDIATSQQKFSKIQCMNFFHELMNFLSCRRKRKYILLCSYSWNKIACFFTITF